MMKLEHVVGQAQQRPFNFDLNGSAEKKATKAHVFLNHSKDTLFFNFLGEIVTTQTARFSPDPNADPNAERAESAR